MKRFTLLALLLASSSVVAAPAPLPKPQRKAERPALPAVARYRLIYEAAVLAPAQLQAVQWNANLNVAQQVGVAILLPPPAPAQPPNADPPG